MFHYKKLIDDVIQSGRMTELGYGCDLPDPARVLTELSTDDVTAVAVARAHLSEAGGSFTPPSHR